MSGTSYVVDTNIALYLLRGDPTIVELLDGIGLHLSVITRMELLSFGGLTPKNRPAIEAFLDAWPVESLHSLIEEEAIRLRAKYRIKLPDSIIAATASLNDLPLVTADKKLLKLDDEIQVIGFQPNPE